MALVRHKAISVAEDLLLNLPQDIRRITADLIKAPMPRGRDKLSFRLPLKYLERKEVFGKRHIVFISYYPAAAFIKKSLVLKQSGNYYLTFIGCCIREDSQPYDFFDQVYEVSDYHELASLLYTATPSAFYAHIQPWIFGLMAVEAGHFTGTPAFVDVNDSVLFIEHEPGSLNCNVENWILKRAAAFSHKMPEKAIAEMRSEWELKTPDYEIQSLPLKACFAESCSKTHDERLKVVFAGGVIPYQIAVKRGNGEHIFDPVIEAVCDSGCDLSFYVNQNARNMFWHEHERYFNLTDRYKTFKFLKGLPFFKLSSTLSHHHIGIHYENSVISKMNQKHFIYNMATKIFSYFEAGLPVLVPQSSSTMCEFVRQHGLGLSYNKDNLKEVLHNINISETLTVLTENVLRFREKNELNTILNSLEEIMDNIEND